MNIGYFGGTFDPIHRGHLVIARAAAQRFALKQVYFVPSGVPPFKVAQPVTEFEHRYAMVALAIAGEKAFLPSLLEAPRPTNVLQFQAGSERGKSQPIPNYSISTVRRLRSIVGQSAKIFFIVGVDAFLQIAKWREPEALLEEVEFVIASRPGFSMAQIAAALPESIRPPAAALKPFSRHRPKGSLVLPGATLHLLDNINENVSSTQIRTAAANGRNLSRYLEPQVAEYARKLHLYRSEAGAARTRRKR
jgi:nicotinate-nucleotide adenylyltransferase